MADIWARRTGQSVRLVSANDHVHSRASAHYEGRAVDLHSSANEQLARTMRALGFSRFDILASFLGESVLLCALGGLLGLLATLPLSALNFGTVNSDTFSEATVSFRFGGLVMAVAFTMTLAMGVFGGLFPALRAVRLDVVRSLREL